MITTAIIIILLVPIGIWFAFWAHRYVKKLHDLKVSR
jgi:hypothetical protein